MSTHVGPEGRPWLAQLPAFDPSDALWPRVLEARARRQRRVRAYGWAAAAGLMLTFGFGWLVGRVDRSDEAVPVASAEHARSAALEDELARARSAATERGAIEIQTELARLDAQLQAAYDRRADGDELRRLWRARGELEAALLAAYQRPSDLVRL